ncbi:MAG: hypothetical protein RLO80_02440 [Hyphomonas sp.]
MQNRKLLIASLLLAGLTLPGAASAQAGGRATSIIQQGSGNAAGIVQAGSDNAAGIRQFGAYNTGTVAQTGSGNSACLIQSGRHLDGAVVQTGDNLSVGVVQTRLGVMAVSAETCATITERRHVFALIAGRNSTFQGTLRR